MKIKVGDKLRIMGLGPETEVISIDEKNGSWIGEDFDSKRLYPLNEIEKYWLGSDIEEIRMYKLAEVKEYWKNKLDK
jgi:hypothetical protein